MKLARGNSGLLARSVRAQLVAGNVLSLLLLLGALGVVVHYAAARAMLASIDSQLEARTRPRPRPPQMPSGGGPPPQNFLFGQFGGPRGPQDENRPPPPEGSPEDGPSPRAFGTGGPPPGERGRPDDPFRPQAFTLAGTPLARGPYGLAHQQAPWDKAAFAHLAPGHALFSTVTVNGARLRVISRLFPEPLPSGQAPRGVIQAAYPLADTDRALAGLTRVLLALVPVALLCAALLGTFLTGRVLRRVRAMTDAMSRIGAEALSERLPAAGEDEFAVLAGTFNALLGRLQTAFQQQNALIEQQRRFTADASHELKTPLTVIQGNASLALSGSPSAADYRETLTEIDAAARQMARLVQDLLLLARADEGTLAPEQGPVVLASALRAAAVRVARKEAAPVRIEADDTLQVTGSEEELTRLVANLLDNALRATPVSGHVSARAVRVGNAAVITVADNGIGIAPEHLTHLGERFYRADSARARQDGGTGLGLSICRALTQAHGGTLGIASVPGAGTTVTVTLPVCSPASVP